ncbi:sulfoacetaldehyde acetyltransferase [Candidatus Persebacteraceae bacterium Df01]|jgi:sulfoacetaldehyde acetyltransferase|uniref:Sulfoacetaldehyde acetyltransferase n=1 Tax=Candidatus Doriopsillibacter californiensis TaxID=2970740 RepID=A0ABT7QMM0_9GAMM|nr:sulfoacetaldehyde acetyltransferase [Candidatus Persebacteraceae bacterium Df01]
MAKMTPSEALVETLVAYGVKDVFGIVGSAYMDALDIFPAAGIRFVPTIHEQGSAHMADGYARASGKHGVCIAQNGPGITNFVTAIAAAYWAHTPVVAITPETGSMGLGLGGFQETEQLPIFSKITKFQGHVARLERMAEITGRCFEYATAERGPTQLNIPRDHFYGEADYTIPTPRDVTLGAGSKKSLDEAAALLAGARFPVIVSGGGVIFSNGVEACKALAEQLNCAVVNSYLHNDSFPCDHPLWAGSLGYQGSKAGMKLLAQADVVLALGSRLGPFGTLPQYGIDYWPKDAKIIQIDADHRMIGLTRPISVGVCGDAKAAALAILSRLQGMENLPVDQNRDSRLATIKSEKATWESELDDWAHEKDDWSVQVMNTEDGGGMHPRQMLRELEKALPDNAMVSTDIGNICSVSNSYLRFRQPNSFFAAMSFGNCGYAFPTIIGAKLAAPDRPAVAYVGDGAWGMSFGEILTCVRENIPVTAVVFNNRQWGAEKKNQVDFYGNRFLGVNLDTPNTTDFSAIAKAMGAEAVRVDNVDQVGEALEKACDAQKQGKTTILEMMCSRELGDPFRRDALKHPVRHLDKYKKFV